MEMLQEETGVDDVQLALNVTRQWAHRLLYKMKDCGEVYIVRWERQKKSGPQSPIFKMRLNEEQSAPRPKPVDKKIIDREKYKRIHSNPVLLAKKNKARRKREKERKKEDPEYVMHRRAESKARYARTKTLVQIDPILAAFMGVKP